MLNDLITQKEHLLHNGSLIMYMMKAMKNYMIRLCNWFAGLIRKVFSSKEDLLEIQGKYTRDKASKVVLFL